MLKNKDHFHCFTLSWKKQENQQTSYYNKMHKKIYNNKKRNNIKTRNVFNFLKNKIINRKRNNK